MPTSSSPFPAVVRWRVLVLTLLLISVQAHAQAPTGGASWKPDFVLPSPAPPFTFIGYGDMRFTNPGDHKHSNPAVRRALIERIAEEKPGFVLISGDVVLTGANAQDWQVFDAETAPLRRAGVELFPALGNHDVRGGEPAALANYFQHFPGVGGRRWYSVRQANVVVFVLDSTSPDDPGSTQWRWLERGLDSLPGDVDFVVLVLHHPPVTHSSDKLLGGGHTARSQEQELASMLEKRQESMRPRIIVLAGHVHNYERYERGGVTYIVSGGGGATPYMVPRAADDFYREPGPTYHLCRFKVDGSTLRFQMVKLTLEGNAPEWRVGDSFELKATGAAAAHSKR